MTTPRRWAAASAVLGAILVVGVVLFQRGQHVESTDAPVDWLGALSNMAQDGFARPTGTGPLDLPQDHAPHPAAQSELWQMSAHLTGPDGVPLTVQFSLMRLGLVPPDTGEAPSIWALRSIYRAHLIVADSAQTVAQERFGRGLAGAAGFDADTGQLYFDTWALAFPDDSRTGAWQFSATSGAARVALELVPSKAPLSIDAADAPFRGYAFTRLDVTGTVTLSGQDTPVTGSAWFDHAWGELPLPGAGPVISDRLALQLDTGDDLSVIVSQRSDGRGVPMVDAFVISADGAVRPLGGDLAQVTFPRQWQGTRVEWPVAWNIRLDDVLELAVAPVYDAQEYDFTPPVWSGLVQAEGRFDGQPVRGTGILQLSGERAP
jgi:predicted secreted hydrolase